nr:MAG TPA: hypothetical protein [Caudoviricetes sp.]
MRLSRSFVSISPHTSHFFNTTKVFATIIFFQEFIIHSHLVSDTLHLFCCVSHTLTISIISCCIIICRNWKKCCTLFNSQLAIIKHFWDLCYNFRYSFFHFNTLSIHILRYYDSLYLIHCTNWNFNHF